MEKSLGWKVRNVHLNALKNTASRDPRGNLDAAVLAKLEEMHQFDIQLYAFATELFEAQLEYYGVPNTRTNDDTGSLRPSALFPSCGGFLQWPDSKQPEE